MPTMSTLFSATTQFIVSTVRTPPVRTNRRLVTWRTFSAYAKKEKRFLLLRGGAPADVPHHCRSFATATEHHEQIDSFAFEPAHYRR